MPLHTDSPQYLDVHTHSSTSPAELIFEISEFAAGLGIFLMALFPLAVPLIAMLVIPLMLVGLLGGLALTVVCAPVMLLRTIIRRARGTTAAGELRPDAGSRSVGRSVR